MLDSLLWTEGVDTSTLAALANTIHLSRCVVEAFSIRDNLDLQVEVIGDENENKLRADILQCQICRLSAFKNMRALADQIYERLSEFTVSNTVSY